MYQNSLGLKACAEVVGNPDRANIIYSKHFRAGPDVDCLVTILTPITQSLLEELIKYPLTMIYVPLKWCGFAYKIFEQFWEAGSIIQKDPSLHLRIGCLPNSIHHHKQKK